jgi:threonine dehydrogenase-like Zn-dependent dehydrogenase
VIHNSAYARCGIPVKLYNEYLRGLIISGRATPRKIVSHRIRIDQGPEACKKFDFEGTRAA